MVKICWKCVNIAAIGFVIFTFILFSKQLSEAIDIFASWNLLQWYIEHFLLPHFVIQYLLECIITKIDNFSNLEKFNFSGSGNMSNFLEPFFLWLIDPPFVQQLCTKAIWSMKSNYINHRTRYFFKIFCVWQLIVLKPLKQKLDGWIQVRSIYTTRWDWSNNKVWCKSKKKKKTRKVNVENCLVNRGIVCKNHT